MILLRRVIGDALRARRQAQHRTLREVSTAANVSLGYLSEIERGQKEASSELLAAVCDALGARLSELLREVSSTVASSERGETAAPTPEQRAVASAPERSAEVPEGQASEPVALVGASEGRQGSDSAALASASAARPGHAAAEASVATTVDGHMAVMIRRDTPLSTTLRARTIRRDVLSGV
ncbi:hypothetical protein GCM10023322_17020 [Rugosimonospora acidiphila]|uniref:HTH cro/C1-type domain-containing protein n=1 Tax=Rugosimonospora acidiphila TaxID=556531 RepID=A0ABP9RP40_9ACTN